jgi:hypothetical protein
MTLVQFGEMSAGQAIQLSVAPAFLLSGIGVFLTMLTNRLARVLDRSRPLEERLSDAGPAETIDLNERLAVLARRARYINRAIALCTISAIAIALVVILLFANAFVLFDLAWPMALLFILSMGSLAAGLVAFLREVQVATRTLRIGKGK